MFVGKSAGEAAWKGLHVLQHCPLKRGGFFSGLCGYVRMWLLELLPPSCIPEGTNRPWKKAYLMRGLQWRKMERT